jgi:hypothetical protein
MTAKRCIDEGVPVVTSDCGVVHVTIGGDCGSAGAVGPQGPAGPQGEPGPLPIISDVEPPLPPEGWPSGMLWINPAL